MCHYVEGRLATDHRYNFQSLSPDFRAFHLAIFSSFYDRRWYLAAEVSQILEKNKE